MDDGRGDGRELQVLIDTQWGLFTQSQVTALGYSRNRVRRLVNSGAWITVLRGVYSIFTGPLTRERVLMAALLYGGGHAMLSHRSAAEEWGFRPPEPTAAVHVTVPYGKSARNQRSTARKDPTVGTRLVAGVGSSLHPGVVVHRSRAHRHIGVEGEMPRTTLVDTAIDLAVSESTPEQAVASLVSSVTDRSIRLTDVREQIALRRPYRTARRSARPSTCSRTEFSRFSNSNTQPTSKRLTGFRLPSDRVWFRSTDAHCTRMWCTGSELAP